MKVPTRRLLSTERGMEAGRFMIFWRKVLFRSEATIELLSSRCLVVMRLKIGPAGRGLLASTQDLIFLIKRSS